MAAAKRAPARQGKKAIRGRMPTKRSINLVLVDENKISWKKAIPGIAIIVVLAVLFSKFLVADRLVAMSQAAGRAARLRSNLNSALELVNSFGDVEDKYAHYTYAGMTRDELSLVDRTQVLQLVGDALPARSEPLPIDELIQSAVEKLGSLDTAAEAVAALGEFRERAPEVVGQFAPADPAARAWSVSGNILTVEVTGSSLEQMNQLARQMEQDPIVDSCTITTANKDSKVQAKTGDIVLAKLIVYLRQPPEEEQP